MVQFAEALPHSFVLQRFRAGTLDVHTEHRKLDTIVSVTVDGLLTTVAFVASSEPLSLRIPPLVGGACRLSMELPPWEAS